MKLKKIAYFIQSLFLLFKQSKSVFFLASLYFGECPHYIFKNGKEFEIQSLLDLLILKETLIDDFYQLKKAADTHPKLIVDIGGGFGDFSIYAAKLFPRARVMAFEPNPILNRLLTKNVELNKVHNVEVYSAAISNKDQLTIDISREPTQTTLFHKDIKNSKTITVKTISLSSILKKKRIDFLKIDCEGGEWDILDGLNALELKKINIISLEYHNQYIEGLDKKIIKKLKASFSISQHPDPFDKNIGNIYAKKV